MKYKISDLAKVLGVTTNTIRRYENNGYLTPERDYSDYRWYNETDISKIAIIRLYRKCGFSHNKIASMLGNSSDGILKICNAKLDEIDTEINRLQHLRHWLKDNIQLMNTLNDIGSGFMLMDCPPLKYVLYSIGDKLLTEKDRLATINQFMYSVHEVQLIHMFKHMDIYSGKFIPHKGWAMKIMDIERLKLWDIITDDNIYIETYPQKKCLYGVLKCHYLYIPNNNDDAAVMLEFYKRAKKYMLANKLELDGDVMAFIVNILGNTIDLLICMPVCDKLQKGVST